METENPGVCREADERIRTADPFITRDSTHPDPSAQASDSAEPAPSTVPAEARQDKADAPRTPPQELAPAFVTYCPHCHTGDTGIDEGWCASCGERIEEATDA